MIINTYLTPNKTFRELRDMVNGGTMDPLRDFSEACREENSEIGLLVVSLLALDCRPRERRPNPELVMVVAARSLLSLGLGFSFDRAGSDDRSAPLENFSRVTHFKLFKGSFGGLGIGGHINLFVLCLNRKLPRFRIHRRHLTHENRGLSRLGFHLRFLLGCRSSGGSGWRGRFRLREADIVGS